VVLVRWSKGLAMMGLIAIIGVLVATVAGAFAGGAEKHPSVRAGHEQPRTSVVHLPRGTLDALFSHSGSSCAGLNSTIRAIVPHLPPKQQEEFRRWLARLGKHPDVQCISGEAEAVAHRSR
jgi:hypothetical protein